MARAMIELTQEFGFDAAHYLGQGAPENSRLHGHSFYCEVTLRGEPDPKRGWLRDLGEVKKALDEIRATLDHRLLNEVEGLANPRSKISRASSSNVRRNRCRKSRA
jgi:6-pyruvoyltetrahydropterin/6-carboxytetrahydropterin synthase